MSRVATLVLTQAEIRALLSMSVCIDLVADVLTTLARGDAQNPLRSIVRLDGGDSLLALMPAALTSPPALGVKVIAVVPGNHGTELDSHQGIVALFDAVNGATRALLDATEITAIRTAAASGAATRVLAREDAGDLALLGSGTQARTHLEAMCCAREIRRVRVFSPKREERERFAARESEKHRVRVEVVDSARAAVEGADLVCTTTSSREPVLLGNWLAPGAHINAVGACFPTARELDTRAVRLARVFVDRRESALHEAGDLLIPMQAGEISAEHIAGELGDVLAGHIVGRRSSDEITLFKSLGIAVEDLATAHWLDREARQRGIGTLVDLGGRRA